MKVSRRPGCADFLLGEPSLSSASPPAASLDPASRHRHAHLWLDVLLRLPEFLLRIRGAFSLPVAGELLFCPYFLRISLPARFCDEQSGHSVYPFPCYPGPLARSWRRPFHRCGVPYPQAPTLDRDSLTTTIAEFMHIGPHPRRLNGTLGTSNSSAPFRNCTEAFDTASPS